LKSFFVLEVELLLARPLPPIWRTKAIVLPCRAKELVSGSSDNFDIFLKFAAYFRNSADVSITRGFKI
jgi:hypothetical protein